MTRRVQVAVTMRRAWPREATPRPRSGAEVGRTPRLKGGGREELRQVRGQGWPRRSYPMSEARGARGPRRAIPLSRSGGAVMRRHPLSKVRSSGCALLEQP